MSDTRSPFGAIRFFLCVDQVGWSHSLLFRSSFSLHDFSTSRSRSSSLSFLESRQYIIRRAATILSICSHPHINDQTFSPAIKAGSGYKAESSNTPSYHHPSALQTLNFNAEKAEKLNLGDLDTSCRLIGVVALAFGALLWMWCRCGRDMAGHPLSSSSRPPSRLYTR